jgi:hypothetical protein
MRSIRKPADPGRQCLKLSQSWPSKPPRRRTSSASVPTLAWSTATRRARLSLHQDRNERDFGHPIVSVSLGLPAIFLWGGKTRGDRARRVPLFHGDVVVWGGPDRLRFHGVHTLAEGEHPVTGAYRYNFTFRRAL